MKIGAKVIAHGRYAIFQMAEVAVPRELFGRLLETMAGQAWQVDGASRYRTRPPALCPSARACAATERRACQCFHDRGAPTACAWLLEEARVEHPEEVAMTDFASDRRTFVRRGCALVAGTMLAGPAIGRALAAEHQGMMGRGGPDGYVVDSTVTNHCATCEFWRRRRRSSHNGVVTPRLPVVRASLRTVMQRLTR